MTLPILLLWGKFVGWLLGPASGEKAGKGGPDARDDYEGTNVPVGGKGSGLLPAHKTRASHWGGRTWCADFKFGRMSAAPASSATFPRCHLGHLLLLL